MKRHLAPVLLLPLLLSAAPSRLAGDLPGFHPALGPVALGGADAALPGGVDLTVLAAGVVDGRAVVRVGSRAPFAGELTLELAGERLSWDGRALRDGKGRELAGAERRAMPGAAVFELWLPADLDGWERALEAGEELVAVSEDGRGAKDELRGALREGERTDHHVAFVHHGNQGLTWTDVLWGHEAGSHEQHWADYLDVGSEHNGFDEVLGLHDLLDVPANFQIAGPLQSAADWYYPDGAVEGWNDWVARGVGEGWAGLLASAYAQHIMPFAQDTMNDWSVATHAAMTAARYGYVPHTAWVPERVWVSPEDNDGNAWNTADHVVDWIGDDWLPHGVWGVLLDQGEHCGYESGWENDHHVYTIDVPGQGQLNVLPIDGSFTGNCHHDAGAAWNQLVFDTSPDELRIYGTDWEVCAEVAGFENQFPSALNNMIWLVQQIAASGGSVAAVKLDEVYGGFGGGPITLQNGTYGLLGGLGGYGSDFVGGYGRNSWYGHWASSPAASDHHVPQWNYGAVWNDAWGRLMAGPENGFAQLGWFTLMTNLYETGWHDGSEISGWIHRYSSHVKNAGVYEEGALWQGGSAWTGTGATLADVDHDGQEELVLWSDRVLAVFEAAGGRAPWIFAKGPQGAGSVVGSCSAYWVDTEGDYNDGSSNNHVAAFSDVDPWLEHEPYAMSVDSLGPGFARVRLEHAGLVKTVALAAGEPWLTVDYEAAGAVRVKHGFTPDYLQLLWSADLERLWDPAASWPVSGWMGQRNADTGLTAALVLGNGGAEHGGEFQGTFVKGDEIVGQGRFRYLFYAGSTSAPDAGGHVAELEALAAQSLDVTPPRLSPAAGFLAPDRALLEFDEDVDAASAENAAHWALEGFPPQVAIVSATRQAWARRVELRLSGLASGAGGTIRAAGVTDLAGNPVDPAASAAAFQMPDGLTPHTIVIDGLNDFDRGSEWMEPRADSLFLTWDDEALFIGFNGRNLATGDFFVHLDTDLVAGSGAPSSSWGRVAFGGGLRPEYELAVEGGGNSLQLNSWSGAWSYAQYGQHGATSYEGWSANPLTEIRLPWSEIGDPAALAVCAGFTAEDSPLVLLAWPQANPVGNGVQFGEWFVFAEPQLPGPLPAAGVRPNSLDAAPPPAVEDLAIEAIGGGLVRLVWSPSAGATGYRIYELSAPWAAPPAEPLAETADTEILLPTDAPTRLFVVTAVQSN